MQIIFFNIFWSYFATFTTPHQVESSRSREPGGQICVYNNFRTYQQETKQALGLRVYLDSDIKKIEAEWKIHVQEKWTKMTLLGRVTKRAKKFF